jgi:hypothetical protein
MNFRFEFSGLLFEVLETWAASFGLLSVEKSWGTRNIAILVDQSPHSGEARDLERSGDPIAVLPDGWCSSFPPTNPRSTHSPDIHWKDRRHQLGKKRHSRDALCKESDD